MTEMEFLFVENLIQSTGIIYGASNSDLGLWSSTKVLQSIFYFSVFVGGIHMEWSDIFSVA